MSTAEKQYRKTKADELLGVLMQSPRSTRELVALVGHRFSASKRVLVERGWEVNSWRTEDGDLMWSLGPYTPRCEVTDEMKRAYYDSQHWQETRRKRLAIDRHKCTLCPMSFGLEVHHWRYDLFAERMEHLATMCKVCHEMIHETDGIQIHFPHFVDQVTAARLCTLSSYHPTNN